MDYQVVLSPSARADLRDIVRYISFDAPDKALDFGRFLISRTRLLAQSPELGRVVPEFARRNLGIYLPNLYHDQSDLVVVVVCPDYDEKEWTGLES